MTPIPGHSDSPPAGGAPIHASGYGWRHGSRINPTLDNVSFTVEPGEKVLLLGESGAGKSTLMAAIAGVLGSDEDGDATGTLTVGGIDPRHTKGVAGLVLQDPDSQVISSRVGDDVVFGCENLGVDRETMWARARWALDVVGLELPLDHDTAKLSGGQKQRLALAGVLAMGAKVILLDEPTANLDPEGVDEVRRAVIDAVNRTGATLVVVEHRVGIWADDVDTAIVLGTGERGIIAHGPVRHVIDTQGARLARQGVWIPGITPQLPAARPVDTPVTDDNAVLGGQELVVGWNMDEPVSPPRNVSIPAGASTVITGDNGAGKTTLALTLAGLLAPLDGRVVASPALSHGTGSSSPHDWSSRQLAGRIGVVFQDPEHQFVARTVREELELGPKIIGGADRRSLTDRILGRHSTGELDEKDRDRIDELLARLRLDHLAKANPFTLSGGQKRRLSVATALVTAPRVLVLDEPTFGQDRRTFTELVVLLRELTDQGVSLISVTHDHLYADALGDYRLEITAR
ncbi:ABC transporter ATP-binding protein [Corynebacterium mendelii]|uniref:ABC transporter ATP-binding protein n=1 Tax=Corynebacterium mendelii TaxID=2765362 RepID=UPI0036287CF2